MLELIIQVKDQVEPIKHDNNKGNRSKQLKPNKKIFKENRNQGGLLLLMSLYTNH